MPRDVWFVIPPDLVLLDFAGAAEAFRLAAQGGAPLRLRYAATAAGVANTSLGIGLTGFGALPATLAADDVVIVCGARGETGQPDAERRVRNAYGRCGVAQPQRP